MNKKLDKKIYEFFENLRRIQITLTNSATKAIVFYLALIKPLMPQVSKLGIIFNTSYYNKLR